MKTSSRRGSRAFIPFILSILATIFLSACPMDGVSQIDESADTGISWSPAPAAESLASSPGWEEETVFYHIWVKSFANTSGDGSTASGTVTDGNVGTFDGITGKLDELDDLGVTGIWLSPIFDCDYKGTQTTDNMHGYDTVDYRSVNPYFGTEEGLKELLSAAHDLGIRVIFDFVPNHSSSSHPWFLSSVSPPPISATGTYGAKAILAGPTGQVPPPGTSTGKAATTITGSSGMVCPTSITGTPRSAPRWQASWVNG